MKHYATDGTIILIFPSASTRDAFCRGDPYGFKAIEAGPAQEMIASKLFIVTDFTQEKL